MSDLVIEKNVPLPVRKSYTKGMTATLRKMKKNESFVVDNGFNGIHSTASRIGVKITTKRLPDGRTRVWRT